MPLVFFVVDPRVIETGIITGAPKKSVESARV